MRTVFLNLGVYLLVGSSLVYGASDKPSAQFPFLGRVMAERVHIRAGQSNNYESVAVVNKDSELFVLGKQYSWYKVALPEGTKLYIKAEYVKALSSEIAEVIADRVNVRARPGTEATVLGQLVKGEQFFIKGSAGEKSDWYLIRPVVKTVGWVHDSFLEFKSAAVFGKNYVPTSNAALKHKADMEAAEQKRAAKFMHLKASAGGQHEASGVVVPVVKLGVVTYKLMGGAKADICVVYLTGASSVLESFVGAKVLVRGTVKDDLSTEALVMTVSKISLAL